MKKIYKASVILAILAHFQFFSFAGQKAEFKGKIEVKNGIKIIKNPSESLYGEIGLELEKDLVLGSESNENFLFYRVWDVQIDSQGNIYVLDSGASRIQKYDKKGTYIQTIGRQGQGPGEFERPIFLYLDKKDFLYVSDMRKIHIFNPEGKYHDSIKIPFFYMDMASDGKDRVVVTGRITNEKVHDLGVMIVGRNGEGETKVAQFPGIPMHSNGTTISHDYSPELRFSSKKNDGFVYGYNREYKLYVSDWTGKIIMQIEKDEPDQSVSRSEKNTILDEIYQNISRAGLGWTKKMVEDMAAIPKNKPFFDRLLVDDKGRIFVRRRNSVLDEKQKWSFDIFSNDGIFLYTTILPFTPTCIKKGSMYVIETSDETGETKVVRYRIRNWERIQYQLQLL